ncbi:MAG: hypothetical protein HN561_12015 [Candidatus Scalindua sp.]|jgi:hypothetical protein|nr:hypothetical protein [Candidatus Scalindua sp.]
MPLARRSPSDGMKMPTIAIPRYGLQEITPMIILIMITVVPQITPMFLLKKKPDQKASFRINCEI